MPGPDLPAFDALLVPQPHVDSLITVELHNVVDQSVQLAGASAEGIRPPKDLL
eukprot:COSAG05_NODE_607_length_8381_cov_9.782057_9_plen_53_part_00